MTSDRELWVCERKMHLPEHDGATGYFYFEPVEPYTALAPVDDAEVKAAIDDWEYVLSELSFNKCFDDNAVARLDKFIRAAQGRNTDALLDKMAAALEGIAPLLDVDCPDMPDEDSIGWQGDKEIPVTFGQVRTVIKTLSAYKAHKGEG